MGSLHGLSASPSIKSLVAGEVAGRGPVELFRPAMEMTPMPLRLRRIDCARGDAAAELAGLRTLLGAQSQVVSARSENLTRQVFGAALTPQQVVERVCDRVRTEGMPALLEFTRLFDRAQLTPQTLRVTPAELLEAYAASSATDPAFLEVTRRIRKNLLSFQTSILHRDAMLRHPGNMEVGIRYRPVRRVAMMVPAGAASYPSTLLMTACPAQAAGVLERVVVMPPTPFGGNNTNMLALCHELGITEVYRMGGAQAVAALAYGVAGICPVDMIVGPGNLFVALAKKLVYGVVGIDCIAGPSEVVVLADPKAPAAFIAAEMLAQAEHSPGSSVLVCWSAGQVEAVAGQIETRLANLSRAELTRDALERYGALVLARDENEAVGITNQLAPEHLQIAANNPKALADRIDHAGAIFLGHYSPVALGDYAAGPSHVLPTGGSARWASGLTSNDFLKRTSIIHFEPAGLCEIAPEVLAMADYEGLTAHAESVRVRLAALADGQGVP